MAEETSFKPSPRSRYRWSAGERWNGPFRVDDGNFGIAQPGSFVPPDRVLQAGADDPGSHLVGRAFDFCPIVAAPASGTTTVLVGPTAAVAFPPVPIGMRAVVLGFWPYLEGAGGVQQLQGRIPGAGVTIRWRLLVDGSPAFPYQNVTTISMPWGSAQSDTPLLEVPQRRLLSVDVTNTDPGGLYGYLGARILVRWIPWDKEWR